MDGQIAGIERRMTERPTWQPRIARGAARCRQPGVVQLTSAVETWAGPVPLLGSKTAVSYTSSRACAAYSAREKREQAQESAERRASGAGSRRLIKKCSIH